MDVCFLHYCDDETISRIREAGILVRVGDSPDSGQSLKVAVVRRDDFTLAKSLQSDVGQREALAFSVRDARRAVERIESGKDCLPDDLR